MVTIRQGDLRTAGRARGYHIPSAGEARALGLKTAFLCHSHQDLDLVMGLLQLFASAGLRLYVDWADTEMPPKPNRLTAEKIQGKICSTDVFLFLATKNSMSSRWCPWEIGYADSAKRKEGVFIIPTSDGYTTHGSEYLDLYRRIELTDSGMLAAWQPGDFQNGRFLRDLW